MGIKREGLYCKACGSRDAEVLKRKVDKGVNVFAVVCPSCEAKGYHAGYKTSRTKEQNDAAAQDKAATVWVQVNGEG